MANRKVEKWERSTDEHCPICASLIEYGVVGGQIVAERCPRGCYRDEFD